MSFHEFSSIFRTTLFYYSLMVVFIYLLLCGKAWPKLKPNEAQYMPHYLLAFSKPFLYAVVWALIGIMVKP